MKITVDLPEIKEFISQAVEEALLHRQSQLSAWKYYTLEETCKLLQVKRTTLLDKRMPFLNALDYSQSGKLFWFLKKSVEDFIAGRKIRKYQR